MDLKLEKWEAERVGRIPHGYVSIYTSGISIPKWAWGHLSEMVDLFYDLKAKVIAIKPSGKSRKLKETTSTGITKLVSCKQLCEKLNIKERKLAKAEWSKKHGMLLIHLGS